MREQASKERSRDQQQEKKRTEVNTVPEIGQLMCTHDWKIVRRLSIDRC